MKRFVILVCFLCTTVVLSDTPSERYFAELQEAQSRYRASIADEIKSADKVVVYLVNFEVTDGLDPFYNDEKTISVKPYESRTEILSRKELSGKDLNNVLSLLSAQIAKPKHSGGAFCHFPIHGIRIYKGGEVLHEGTFCWVCENFTFRYPLDFDYLDTTNALKALFAKLLPIPEKELERFKRRYPNAIKPSEQNVPPKSDRAGG